MSRRQRSSRRQPSSSRRERSGLSAAAGNSSRNLRDCGAADPEIAAGWMHPLASMPVIEAGSAALPGNQTARPPAVCADRSGCARDHARQTWGGGRRAARWGGGGITIRARGEGGGRRALKGTISREPSSAHNEGRAARDTDGSSGSGGKVQRDVASDGARERSRGRGLEGKKG